MSRILTGRRVKMDPRQDAIWGGLLRYARDDCGYWLPRLTVGLYSGLIVDGEACRGYTESGRGRSRIWVDASRDEILRTAAHELAHAIAHGCTTSAYPMHGSIHAVIASVLERRVEDMERAAG